MNKNIKLAVAGAVLALSASAANAGIVIPAGDWTLDISGNVNMFTTWTKAEQNAAGTTINGGLASAYVTGNNTTNNFTTGLLPNFLSVGGSTRQNDLDVTFAISIQPGSSNTGTLQDVNSTAGGGLNNRQSYLTFGDKSWGTIKVGKDLGIFASDAILSDMTLLGVGGITSAGSNTTLGRIGTGYIYADWKPQIAYTTPNLNGFQATVGISQAWNQASVGTSGIATTTRGNASPAYEGKASYSFSANDVNGKVWVSAIGQKTGSIAGYTLDDKTAYAVDIGANVNFAGFGLTGYYYDGEGMGTTGQFNGGLAKSGTTVYNRDSSGGYVQATYVLPTKTKIGASWGISELDKANGETGTALVKENEMWVVGAYHPLTKHLNVVAEWTKMDTESHNGLKDKNYTGSLGAILFF